MDTDHLFVKPQFNREPDSDFYPQLRKIVREYVASNNRYVYLLSGIKTILLFSINFSLYFLVLEKGNSLSWLYGCYAALGLTMMMIFLNVIHPAAHHSLFRKNWLNDLCQYALEIFGTSSYLWRARHIKLHHPYPNIPNWDCDIEQSDLIKIFPGAKYHWYHKYQHFYSPFLYIFYTLIWIFIRDFRDFFDEKRIVRKAVEFPRIQYYKLFISKIFYLTYILIVPFVVLDVHPLHILGAFLVLHIIASSVGLIALVSSHAGETTSWTYPGENGRVDNTWAYHQMISANDFSTANPFANLAFGHFNHHVAHHLFPTINPQLYKSVTRIVREFSEKHQLPYRCFTIRQTMLSHFKLLRNSAYRSDLMDADL